MNVVEMPVTDIDNTGYHPLVLDFDFSNLKPRGASSRIDFFSYGKLCEYMDGQSSAHVVYIRKDDLQPQTGFFLLDFKKYLRDLDGFASILEGMKIKKLYIENSGKFDVKKFALHIPDVEFVLVDFVNGI